MKHFSKWSELVLLPNCTSEKATYAFLDMVFDRFGALAKVLTDQGTKFYGEFQELCEKTFNRHTTSRNHLEANKSTKWMVHMVKPSLRKYGLHKGHT